MGWHPRKKHTSFGSGSMNSEFAWLPFMTLLPSKLLPTQFSRLSPIGDQPGLSSELELNEHRKNFSVENLELIDGMDANQKRNYAKQFMEVVIQYAKETNISTNVNSNETVSADFDTLAYHV